MFQSTHPHGVRPIAPVCGGYYLFVSIHAPTRGATETIAAEANEIIVSIHAPTRGATAETLFGVADSKVSIHAPTRGAT